MAQVSTLIDIASTLKEQVNTLEFTPPVAYVYNPLEYAWEPHRAYLERWARPGIEALMLGMNPGPWGMVQTGVPFGEVAMVRDFLGIEAPVGRPEPEHPKRPVLGFQSPRSEVSGRRLWGWVKERFETPEAFFQRFFVWNDCPLAFLEESGRNRTPDKLPVAERAPLALACNEAIRGLVEVLQPRLLIGVGAHAEKRLREVFSEELAAGTYACGSILHPSPASPAANRGWAEQAERQLLDLGVELPGVAPPQRERSKSSRA